MTSGQRSPQKITEIRIVRCIFFELKFDTKSGPQALSGARNGIIYASPPGSAPDQHVPTRTCREYWCKCICRRSRQSANRPFTAATVCRYARCILIGELFWCCGWNPNNVVIILSLHTIFYYRAMHFSAKRGLIAMACRPSVCPSVTLVDCDHIGWKSWKLITQTVC